MASKTKSISSVLAPRDKAPAADRLAQLSAGAPLLAAVPSAPVPLAAPIAGYAKHSQDVEYPVGALVELPLELVVDDPLQPRVYYPEASLLVLKNSISTNGQLTPIQVYPADENGQYMLRSGHRRCRVLKLLDKSAVLAEIVPRSKSRFADYRKAREINLRQNSHTYLDDSVRFRQLIDEKLVLSQEALAHELGETESHVSKCLSIGTLPPGVLSLMSQNVEMFGLSSAYTIFRFWQDSSKDEVSTLKLVEEAVKHGLSVRRLEELSVKKLDELIASNKVEVVKRKRDRAMSRAVLTGAASGELKAFEGKLTLKLSNLNEQNRAEFFQRLLKVFQELGLQIDSAAKPD